MAEPSDFQAIVFAGGRGSRMPTLCDHKPKPLLPVANLPMFWYPLNLLHRNGIKDCILVVNIEQRAAIEKALAEELPEMRELQIEVVAFTEEEEDSEDVEEWGTGDVLRRLLGKLKKEHILLVSGDLVSDLVLTEMFALYAERSAVMTCLLTDAALGGPVPGPKEPFKKYRDFVLLTETDNHLLYLADEEDHGEVQSIPRALLIRNPVVNATAKFKDVHLYAVQRSAVQQLLTGKTKEGDAFASVKADLVPALLERHSGKCFAWFPAKQLDFTLIAQCNNLGTYFEGNKIAQKLLPTFCPGLDRRRFEKGSGVNCSESWVPKSGDIKGKCQLKRSIIGEKCVIGEGAKVDNSVLMEEVEVGNGAFLKNCIVFEGAKIGEKADLTMCIVGPGQKVAQKAGKLANKIVAEERTMELD